MTYADDVMHPDSPARLIVPEIHDQNRWTVLIRAILIDPARALGLFFFGIGAFFATIYGWFAALVTGSLPTRVANWDMRYADQAAKYAAYGTFLTDVWPGFWPTLEPGGETRVEVQQSQSLNRLAVLFRIILVIPAGILQGVTQSGGQVVSIVAWIITLVNGRLPNALHRAYAASIRWQVRTVLYFSMVSSAYPSRYFGDADGELSSGSIVLPTASQVLLGVFIVLGAILELRSHSRVRFLDLWF